MEPAVRGTFNPMSYPPLLTPVFTVISVTRTLLQGGLSGQGLGVHIALLNAFGGFLHSLS